nr:hypothetical protein CFP56_34096 [Quercus suber]
MAMEERGKGSERWSGAITNPTEMASNLESLQKLLLKKAVFVDEETFAKASLSSEQARTIKIDPVAVQSTSSPLVEDRSSSSPKYIVVHGRSLAHRRTSLLDRSMVTASASAFTLQAFLLGYSAGSCDWRHLVGLLSGVRLDGLMGTWGWVIG